MDSLRTSITMIEMIFWIWLISPVLLITVLYLLLIGWKSPREVERFGSFSDKKRTAQQTTELKRITVWSADTNKVDEQGGPYEVEIKNI